MKKGIVFFVGVLMLLFTIQSALAETSYSAPTGATYAGSTLWQGITGGNFSLNVTGVTSFIVKRNSAVTKSTAYVIYPNGTIYANAPYNASGEAYFNFSLATGNWYFGDSNNGTGSTTQREDNGYAGASTAAGTWRAAGFYCSDTGGQVCNTGSPAINNNGKIFDIESVTFIVGQNIITASLSNLVNGSSFGSVLFWSVTGNLTFSYFNITGSGFCVTYTGNGTGTNCTAGNGASTYYNVTNTTTITSTQTVTAATYQALISITGKQLFTNNTLTGFNITNGQATNTTITTSLTIPANNGSSNNLKLDHSGNYSLNQSCTATSPLTTSYCNITGIYDNLYNITAYHNTTGATITAFTANVTNDTLGGTLYSTATTNGTTIFPLLQGYQYYFTITATGYAHNNKTLGANATAQRYNFSLYTRNTVNFSFYDENNGSNMNGTNITLDLIGTIESATHNTVNGSIVTQVMSPDTYTVRYSATGYAERFYRFTLQNNTYYEFSLPMLLSSAATSVTVSVIDNTAKPLSSAIVTVYKYDVTTNTYKTNQVFTTNNEGEGVIDVELNDEFYYFTVTYNGAIVLTTSPSYLYANTLTLTVLLQNLAFQKLFNQYGITGSIANSTPTLFTFTYADNDYTATRGCLYAYRYGTNNMTLYNSTCNTGSGGTATVGLDSSTNKTYYLYGVVRKSSTDYTIVTSIITYNWRATGESSKRVWMVVMLVIITIMVVMFRDSLGLAVIIAGLIPVLFSWAGMISFGLGYTVPLFIVSIIIAYIIERD